MVQPKWPLELTIVRHGLSKRNAAVDFVEHVGSDFVQSVRDIRDPDIELMPAGILQAEETGKFLAKFKRFDFCLSSPYRRTIQTAEGIIKHLGYDLEIRLDDRLRERDFGFLDGMNKEEIRKNYPLEEASRKKWGKYYYRPPGGESYPDVKDGRLRSVLDKLHRDHAGQRGLIVTHQVCYKEFRDLFEHLGEKNVLALPETPNCAIQVYKLDQTIPGKEEGRMKLTFYDHVAYGEELTPPRALSIV